MRGCHPLPATDSAECVAIRSVGAGSRTYAALGPEAEPGSFRSVLARLRPVFTSLRRRGCLAERLGRKGPRAGHHGKRARC